MLCGHTACRNCTLRHIEKINKNRFHDVKEIPCVSKQPCENSFSSELLKSILGTNSIYAKRLLIIKS